MGLLLLIILIVVLMGGLPNWGYHSYGWGPSGIAGVVLLIVLILFLSGRLRRVPTSHGRQGQPRETKGERLWVARAIRSKDGSQSTAQVPRN